MKLSDLHNGQQGIITRVRGRGQFRKRITEMGFIRGKTITVIKNAPLKDPIEYRLMGYNISLRRSEAALIDVEAPTQADASLQADYEATRRRHRRRRGGGMGRGYRPLAAETVPLEPAPRPGTTIRVAMVGNPNSGKTTIFNYASGSRERVGNYGGVTVRAKEGRFHRNGTTFIITDLPGTYSITEYSPEELFVRNHIIDNQPDVVINVVDSTNLERNLYLTTQLIDMNVKVVVALNMHDEMIERGDSFDYTALGDMLGIPFVPTVGTEGVGILDLFDTVAAVHEGRDRSGRNVRIYYGPDIESAIAGLVPGLEHCTAENSVISPRYAAIKLLEKDAAMESFVATSGPGGEETVRRAGELIQRIETALGEDSETLMSDARYGFIAGAIRETFHPAARPAATMSERIDGVLTHQVLGFPLFLFFMWVTFQLTFSLGRYPMDWIEAGVAHASSFITGSMSPGLLREILVDGILAGAGGVVVFLPNILILFFMISLMEDTGYMARAAFIMDRLMHGIGLHGKSFIPLVMGFGCNVPAIMATRTLESRKERILTMLIIPFMSCSARLPVFVLFIGVFFPRHAGSMLFALYMGGVAVAVVSAMAIQKIVFRAVEAPFVMELPPYRSPRLRNSLRHMWGRGSEYLKKIGGIVLIASILIWALGRFPENVTYSKDYDALAAQAREGRLTGDATPSGGSGALLHPGEERIKHELNRIELEREGERLEQSYIGQIGSFIQPALSPLGFDWKMSVSIFTGLAAKEITVSTLGVLYHARDNSPEIKSSLQERIREQRYTSGPREGKPVFGPAVALAYMVFILLYVPCMATLVTMKRESGSWKWPLFSAFFSTTVAWIAAFMIYRIGLMVW
ncbi:MAG: ferrous iron transport protein B [Spirochaetes bacterium]|nr:ferrous iron transport protein B [Spirochaetota bacterium]